MSSKGREKSTYRVKVVSTIVVTLVTLTATLGVVAQAQARAISWPSKIDLLSDADAIIDGAVGEDRAGRSVASAGDVNGDGFDDVIIGAPETDHPGTNAGSAYVVFGGPSFRYANFAVTTYLSTSALDSIGKYGFRIRRSSSGYNVGWSVAGAGDVNRDGLDDVIVGAREYVGGHGATWVVFGKRDNTDAIDLADLNEAGNGEGFRIGGTPEDSFSPSSVDGVGDINGDGRDDVILSAERKVDHWVIDLGSGYVIFGKSSTEPVDLANIGESGNTNGFKIESSNPDDLHIGSAAGAGDVNDDDIPDLVVGAPQAANDDHPNAGGAFVVFGKPDTGTVDLASIGDGDNRDGFRILGATPPSFSGHRTGEAVSGAGDTNGDGLADVVVGAPKVEMDGPPIQCRRLRRTHALSGTGTGICSPTAVTLMRRPSGRLP